MPHPSGEALEVAERFAGGGIGADTAHIAVDAIGGGPVGFDGHGAEAFVFDEQAGEPGALAVDLVGAVRGRAQEPHARVADGGEQGGVVGRGAVEHLCALGRQVREGGFGNRTLGTFTIHRAPLASWVTYNTQSAAR